MPRTAEPVLRRPSPARPAARRSSWRSLVAAAALVAGCGGGGGSGAAPSAGPAAPTLPGVDTSEVAIGNRASALPAGWQQGVFMEIFVRSWRDSDGDGIGDLKGLISTLDYLKDLGIRGIWLMPVFASQDKDHGYAVTDYRAIEPQYGTLADFDELIAQAHARGIGVIVDFVINHSAADHPAFANARSATTNAFRDWYVWQPTVPSGWSIYGGNPWRADTTGAYFAPFSPTMPDFNLRNPATVAWHEANLRFWLNRGVDGFRFDAVANLIENGPAAWEAQPESIALMGRLRQVVQGYDRRYMVCEAPAAARAFGEAGSCGGSFAFDLNRHVVQAALGNAASIAALADYFRTAPAGMAVFASNHDLFAGQRLSNQLGGDLARMKLAAASYLLLPGTPFVYYGEEIGMAGALSMAHDGQLRTPMSWTADTVRGGFTTGVPYRALSDNVATQNVAAQRADPDSLWSHYRRLIALRHGRSSLTQGSYERPFVQGLVMGFQRADAAQRTLVLVNYGTQPASVALSGLSPGAVLTPLLPGGTTTTADAGGAAAVTLPAQTVQAFDLR